VCSLKAPHDDAESRLGCWTCDHVTVFVYLWTLADITFYYFYMLFLSCSQGHIDRCCELELDNVCLMCFMKRCIKAELVYHSSRNESQISIPLSVVLLSQALLVLSQLKFVWMLTMTVLFCMTLMYLLWMSRILCSSSGVWFIIISLLQPVVSSNKNINIGRGASVSCRCTKAPQSLALELRRLNLLLLN
jgi:hypothetical protein